MKRQKKTPRKKILTREQLHRYADSSSYARGVEYFESGAVNELQVEGKSIRANVQGSRLYQVKLWVERDELEYTCTCPFFEQEQPFCKHCVAAGLAYLENERSLSHHGEGNGGPHPLTLKDVKAHLLLEDQEKLTSIILDHARDDDEFRDRLMMMVSMKGDKLDLSVFRQAIDRAAHIDYRGDYVSPYQYGNRVGEVITSLRGLLNHGNASDVVVLSEYLLHRLDENVGLVEDDGGASEEAQELHHAACRKAKPDPIKLAEKLFRWEVTEHSGTFYNARQIYADVLGKKGMQAYRSLVESEWVRVPTLRAGGSTRDPYPNRSRITSLMEDLASETEDIETLVSIKSRDLSFPDNYLEIAELYRKNKRPDKALEWAEKGLEAYPEGANSQLREFLANEYHRRNRHDEAMQLLWAEFSDHAGLENYKLLKTHAMKCGRGEVWQQWKEKAIAFIRASIDRQQKKLNRSSVRWFGVDRSELVRIYLWEKNVEQAWREAQEGECSRGLWLKLADAREHEHPEDALAVYQSFVEPTVELKNNDAYEEAIDLVKKVFRLMNRLGRKEGWDHYVQTLAAQHKRKRNFVALLEKLK